VALLGGDSSNGNRNWNTHYRNIPLGGGYGMTLQESKFLH
jgi:hypothetical protein